MAKAKRSLKKKTSSKNTLTLKADAPPLIPYRRSEEILKGNLIGKVILECLKNNDPEGVMDAISFYLETVDKVKASEQANLPRSTLYHSLKNRNPTVKTLAKLVSVGAYEARKLK